jgi:hypothetical protein
LSVSSNRHPTFIKAARTPLKGAMGSAIGRNWCFVP